ncbi:MAG: SEC-C domain-containing protein, partial [Oscillibacter sp.]|nr:SEC-C domain-containing protein [Oscillibacter sp.]
GDPGATRFSSALEDDLMRLFGGDRIQNRMERFDLDEDTPIENKMLTKAIENAQTTVESRNFQSRKSVLEYDDVMNKQREIIYDQRRQVLDGMDIKETVLNMMHTAIEDQVSMAFGQQSTLDNADYKDLLKSMEGIYFPRDAVKFSPEEVASASQQDFSEKFIAAAEETYARKEIEITPAIMRELERVIMLRVVDEYWMDHIDAMDDLKQGIRLQAYGNNNPVDVYKRESLDMFEEMISAIQAETVRRLYSVQLKKDEEVKRERVAKGMVENVGGDGTAPKKQPMKVTKIGRNDPCPCGSGLKWKKCTCPEYHKD